MALQEEVEAAIGKQECILQDFSEEIFQALAALVDMLAIVHVEKQVFRRKFW